MACGLGDWSAAFPTGISFSREILFSLKKSPPNPFPRVRVAMHRRLKRLPLGSLGERLVEKGVVYAEDFFNKTDVQLLNLLGASVGELEALYAVVCSHVTPCPKTALDMLKAESPSLFLSRTPPVRFDAGMVTELVGAPGMGKTQACLTLTATVGRTASVVYIDTESAFSPSRLIEIAAKRFPREFSSPGALQGLTSRVKVFSAPSAADLCRVVNKLENVVIEQKSRLVILDSIAAPMRAGFTRDRTPERQKLLVELASKLKHTAESLRVPVVVTNQVTTKSADGTDGRLAAALGIAWAHAVNTRYHLRTGASSDTRVCVTAKSPTSPSATVEYNVTGAGFTV